MPDMKARVLSTIKLVILFLALLIFYRLDFVRVNISALGVLSGPALGFVLSAVFLSLSGLVLKRRLISQLSSVSKRNYLYGTVVLIFSISLYVYGSYSSAQIGLIHYESFISFIFSYILLRFETKTAQTLSPIFLMSALLPIPFSYDMPYLDRALSAPLFASADLIFFYSVFMKFSRSSLLISTSMAALSFVIWRYPILTPLTVGLPFIAVIQGSKRFRSLLGDEVQKVLSACNYSSHTNKEGFCYICGQRIVKPSHLSWNLGGLAIMLLLVFAVAQVRVPVLALENGDAEVSTLTYYGWQNQTVPATPAGWLRYYDASNVVPGDIYSNTAILVPAFHPETRNYTVTYEISSFQPAFMSSIGAAPGYNWTSQLYQIGGVQGHMIVGVDSESNVIAFTTRTSLLFVNSSGFVTENTGITIERQFPFGNLSQQTTAFVSDASSILASIYSQTSGGGWTPWLESALYALKSAANLLLVVVSVGIITSITYMLFWTNRKHLKAIQLSSNLSRTEWAILSLIYMKKKPSAVGSEISDYAGATSGSPDFLDRVAESFASLERKGLLRGILQANGNELRMTWKVSV